ncbi:MAG: ribonuclease J [Alphaproteobacteria bacterium]|jgi:ribonuclease J|nr:ribonuclease J [Alphaproteobacteria bacterium]MBT7943802.1 ribonuclease J [Alphaproteobacteria bacterium]
MTASSDELTFLPLGGAGEIGMNLNLYGFGPKGRETWVMVDLGITFGNGSLPGLDVLMPDPAFIEERRDQLAGLVLTHAHEDHLGAVPYLWDRLQCPIYATPFTISILKRKLGETDFADRVEIIEVPLGGRFEVGPFDMELITLTHSIPEPNAIAIRTPVGTVLHTGDWKFDPGPVIGDTPDKEALSRLGDEGVLALVCDSTNVFTPGESGSEADLLDNLSNLIGECQGRVAVACFATNVARLETIARAAAANDRDVVLAGRSLWRINDAARENGYLGDIAAFIAEEDAGHIPNDKVLIICTGSQGEPRAALSRIAAGDHRHITLGNGDTVIFSARAIPGNEAGIGTLQNRLVRGGVRVVTARDNFIHVSGHPARDELAQMYQLSRPQISVPVHGERRHLEEHASLALECQVPKAIVVENGSMVRLAPIEAGITEEVPYGRLALDGNRLVPIDGELVRGRIRALFNGSAVLSVVLYEDGGWAAEPELSTIGVLDGGEEAISEDAIDAAKKALKDLSAKERKNDDKAREAMRIAVRRTFRKTLDKKPQTTVHLIRIAKP